MQLFKMKPLSLSGLAAFLTGIFFREVIVSCLVMLIVSFVAAVKAALVCSCSFSALKLWQSNRAKKLFRRCADPDELVSADSFWDLFCPVSTQETFPCILHCILAEHILDLMSIVFFGSLNCLV